MNTLLLGAALAIQFPGGTPNDFITALAKETKSNVMMSQGDTKKLEKAAFNTTDLDEMARAIRSQLKHAILPGSDLIISDQLVSQRLISGGRQIRFAAEQGAVEVTLQRGRQEEAEEQSPFVVPLNFQANYIPLPASAIKDGKVTYVTEKSDSLKLEFFRSTFGKPISVHWVYADAPLFVHVTDMPEADFMRWAAKAVGAKLASNADGYKFELDPTEFKRRAISTIKATPLREGPRENVQEQTRSRDFRISVINTLSNSQLSEALASAGTRARFELNARNPLTRLALNRVRERDQAAGNRQPPILQRVDPSRMALMIVDSRLNVQVEVPVLNQNGRPGGVVRVD